MNAVDPRSLPESVRAEIAAQTTPAFDLEPPTDKAPNPAEPPRCAATLDMLDTAERGESASAESVQGEAEQTIEQPEREPPPAAPAPYARRIVEAHEIPAALVERRVWVAWRLEQKEGKAKPDKIPLSPITGRESGWSKNPQFAGSFEQACSFAQRHPGRVQGLGILLWPGCGLSGIDLDHCRDPVSGELSELATEIMSTAETYFEVSPGLSGIRGFFLGGFGGHTGNNHEHGIEFYEDDGSRFLTVTGDHIEDSPFSVESRDLTDLGRRFFSTKREKSQRTAEPPADFAPFDLSSVKLKRHTLKVISGDVSSYGGDRSKALFAVAKDLVKAGLSDTDIARVLCDPKHGISAKPLSERAGDVSSAMDWVIKYTVDKAREAVAADPAPSSKSSTPTGDPDAIEAERQARIQAAREECSAKLQAFNALHGIVMIEGRACIVYREINAGTGRHTTRYSTPKDIALRYKPSKVPIVKEHANGKVTTEQVSLFSIWLEWQERRTYSQLVFKPVPGLVAGPVTLPDGDVLNLYQGLAITPKPGRCELIKAHVQNVWCSGDPVLYQYVMDWLARMFQRPQERGHTVLVLRSGEGTGKNTIVDMLVEAFGEHAMVAVKPDELTGRFNDDLATSVLVFANEAVWGGKKELEGALKSLITDEELPIERKFIPRFRVRNCCHLIMASNNDWVAPIGLDDRRFVVMDVAEHRKDDHQYFGQLHAEINNGGREAFVWELLNRDIAQFNPRILPQSRAFQSTKFEAKVRGSDSVTQWWIDCLYSGEIMATVEREESVGITTRIVKQRENLALGWESGSVEVERDAVYNAYVEWANRTRRHVETQTSFGRKIRTLTKIQDTRRGPKGGPLKRMYRLDTLDTARVCLDTKMKQPGPWAFDGKEGGQP